MKKRLILLIILAAGLIALILTGGIAAFADDTGLEDINQNISDLLKDLDLSELQKYLDENTDSYLLKFGSTAGEIVEYLIHGNLGTDYGGYLSELFSIIFKNIIALIPAFAEITAVALLSAIVSSAEGNILGKSTSKIVHLACYSLIILILASMLTGIVTNCIACVNRIKRQIEIITPILATLTVLTGGTSSAAIYQPSAIFLSGGAVEIVSGFIFPAAIAVIVLNFMSKLNPQMSFSGVTTFVKSIMKWVIGITEIGRAHV